MVVRSRGGDDAPVVARCTAREKRNPFRFALERKPPFSGSGWETASPLDFNAKGAKVLENLRFTIYD